MWAKWWPRAQIWGHPLAQSIPSDTCCKIERVSATEVTEILAPAQQETYGRFMGRANRATATEAGSTRRQLAGARSTEEYQVIWQQAYEAAVARGVYPQFARLTADQAQRQAFEADTGFRRFHEPDNYF